MTPEATLVETREKLSIDEIKKRYPDEWVVLVGDDDVSPLRVGGVVLAHSPDRDALHRTIMKLKLPSCATMCTGKRKSLTMALLGIDVD